MKIIHVQNPSELTNKEVNQINDFILSCGACITTQKRNIRNSYACVILKKDDEVIGYCAVKQPNNTRKYKIAMSIGLSTAYLCNNFHYELGHICIHKDYRKQGLASAIVNQMMLYFDQKQFFLTTKSDNLAIIKIAKSLGCKKLGNTYKSERSQREIAVYSNDKNYMILGCYGG